MKEIVKILLLALIFGAAYSHQSKIPCKLAEITGNSTVCNAVFSKLVYPDPNNGSLIYKTYGDKGDKIVDFSSAGYKQGRVDLPKPSDIKVVETLEPSSDSKDDTKRIQDAINKIGQRDLDDNGFRGALQLKRGEYTISSGLKLSKSGVVVQGDPNGGTVITATSQIDKLTYVISIGGSAFTINSTNAAITAPIAVGQTTVQVNKPNLFKVGDRIKLGIRYNEAWIKALKMDVITRHNKNQGWTPKTINFFRRVERIEKDTLYLNSPITTRYDAEYDGGTVVVYNTNSISNVGIQDIVIQYPTNKDRGPDFLDKNNKSGSDYRFAAAMFSNILFYIQNVEDAWIKNVKSVWFRNYIQVQRNALQVTLKNCSHTFPHTTLDSKKLPSLVGQFAFEILGQQILLDQCLAEYSFHAYSFKASVVGPNVITNSKSIATNGDIGPHNRWSTGQLYDNCEFDGMLKIENRFEMGNGHGWAGANSVVWNTVSKSGLVVQKPPTAENFIIGSTSKRAKAHRPDEPWGLEESPDHNVYPQSLYAAQLSEMRSTVKASGTSKAD